MSSKKIYTKENGYDKEYEEDDLGDDFFDFMDGDGHDVGDPDDWYDDFEPEPEPPRPLWKDFLEAIPFLLAFAAFVAAMTWWGVTHVHHLAF